MPRFRRAKAIGGAVLTAGQQVRSWIRYRPAVTRARIGWWEGYRFRTVHARLVDIGNGGAAIRLGSLPPPGRSVYLRLQDQRMPTESISGEIVGLRADPPHGYRANVAFHVQCPPGLFEAATRGFDSLEAILN